MKRIANNTQIALESLHIDIAKLKTAKAERFPDVTDTEFAGWLGITPSTFSDYQNNKKAIPSLPVALRAAILLDIDLRLLVPDAKKLRDNILKNLR